MIFFNALWNFIFTATLTYLSLLVLPGPQSLTFVPSGSQPQKLPEPLPPEKTTMVHTIKVTETIPRVSFIEMHDVLQLQDSLYRFGNTLRGDGGVCLELWKVTILYSQCCLFWYVIPETLTTLMTIKYFLGCKVFKILIIRKAKKNYIKHNLFNKLTLFIIFSYISNSFSVF